MTQTAEMERMAAKTGEQQFLWVMEEEYRYSPRVSKAILEEAEICLYGKTERIRPGQQVVILTEKGERHGQALEKVKKVEIVWTIDAGIADCRYAEEHGKSNLRQLRIRRMVGEALEQGGVATQEDLARALHVSVRTIKRDFAAMKTEGMVIASRGYVEGIGRGQSHKGIILERWLRGETYDQLMRHTGHSVSSIQRYVHTFLQVVELDKQGFGVEEIAQLVQIGVRLTREYLEIMVRNQSSVQKERLENQRKRMIQAKDRGTGLKKGAQ
jgi:DNA-binding transcriptional regulator YhcF (GntR family)